MLNYITHWSPTRGNAATRAGLNWLEFTARVRSLLGVHACTMSFNLVPRVRSLEHLAGLAGGDSELSSLQKAQTKNDPGPARALAKFSVRQVPKCLKIRKFGQLGSKALIQKFTGASASIIDNLPVSHHAWRPS